MPGMKLLESLSFNTMRPAWRFEPGGVIWRIVPAGGDLLLGEARAITTREVSFFCVDLATGMPLWDRREFGYGWWTGIEAVLEGVALIHGFASPDMPRHRGLTGVDLRSGRELWSRTDVRFLGTARGLLVAETGAGELGLLLDLDLHTGYVRRSRPAAGAAHLLTVDHPPASVAARFPRPLEADPDAGDALAALAREHCPAEELPVPPEVFDAGSTLVLSYHEPIRGNGPAYRNVLKVIDVQRRALLYEDVLDAEVGAAAPESFLVIGSLIVYIRERRVLTALRLA